MPESFPRRTSSEIIVISSGSEKSETDFDRSLREFDPSLREDNIDEQHELQTKTDMVLLDEVCSLVRGSHHC